LPAEVKKHVHPVLSKPATVAVALLTKDSAESMPSFSPAGTLILAGNVSAWSSERRFAGAPSSSDEQPEVCQNCGCLPKGQCKMVNAALCPRMDSHLCSKEQEAAMAQLRKIESQKKGKSVNKKFI
jgi:hypothetical protein